MESRVGKKAFFSFRLHISFGISALLGAPDVETRVCLTGERPLRGSSQAALHDLMKP
jgi:hypothetical protein